MGLDWKSFVLTFVSLIIDALGLLPIEIQVNTRHGTIQGEERDHFIAFEGIPYAEPPSGDLRFEPPVPFKSNVNFIQY